MDPKNTHGRTKPQQKSTDDSQQRSSQADPRSPDHDSSLPVFYLEADDDTSEDRAIFETDSLSLTHGSRLHQNNNREKDCDREKGTKALRKTAVAQSTSPKHVQHAMGDGDDDVMDSTGAQTPQGSWDSAWEIPPGSRTTPPPSPLSTVCRESYSSLEVRCQVNWHNLSTLSSSCPAAFSPKWTQVVTPVASSSRSKGGLYASGRARRHTLGPTSHVSASLLQQQYPHHSDFQGLSRSLSDSELQHWLRKGLGKELRKMSDEFNYFKTGKRLATVSESTVSDESSLDDQD